MCDCGFPRTARFPSIVSLSPRLCWQSSAEISSPGSVFQARVSLRGGSACIRTPSAPGIAGLYGRSGRSTVTASGVYIKPDVDTPSTPEQILDQRISAFFRAVRELDLPAADVRRRVGSGSLLRRCGSSCDSKFREPIDRSRQHGFVPVYNNRPLYEFRVVCHQLEQLIIAEILAGYLLAVRWFIRSQDILRLQSRVTQ
jgi:hypothetical protein